GAHCEAARVRRIAGGRAPHRSGEMASADHELLPLFRRGRRSASFAARGVEFHEGGGCAGRRAKSAWLRATQLGFVADRIVGVQVVVTCGPVDMIIRWSAFGPL